MAAQDLQTMTIGDEEVASTIAVELQETQVPDGADSRKVPKSKSIGSWMLVRRFTRKLGKHMAKKTRQQALMINGATCLRTLPPQSAIQGNLLVLIIPVVLWAVLTGLIIWGMIWCGLAGGAGMSGSLLATRLQEDSCILAGCAATCMTMPMTGRSFRRR
jgi:hypothetical protein